MLSFIFSNQTHSQFFFLTLDCTPIIELSIVVEPYQSHSGITLLMTSSGNNISIKYQYQYSSNKFGFFIPIFRFFFKKKMHSFTHYQNWNFRHRYQIGTYLFIACFAATAAPPVNPPTIAIDLIPLAT